MTVSDLITEVLQAGGQIWAAGDHLELEAPRPLPSDLLERIKAHKAEILNALQTGSAAALAGAFYQHLFGVAKQTGCCYAPADRYCPEGRRLRDAYYRTRS